MNTAGERIDALQELMGEITRRTSHLHNEVDEVIEQWEGLITAGGGRDDHAAELLKHIQPHLESLALLFQRCNKQCIDSIKNPFAR